MPHTKLLIEQWLPIAPIGAEVTVKSFTFPMLEPFSKMRSPWTIERSCWNASPN